jgi:hypothetical protein
MFETTRIPVLQEYGYVEYLAAVTEQKVWNYSHSTTSGIPWHRIEGRRCFGTTRTAVEARDSKNSNRGLTIKRAVKGPYGGDQVSNKQSSTFGGRKVSYSISLWCCMVMKSYVFIVLIIVFQDWDKPLMKFLGPVRGRQILTIVGFITIKICTVRVTCVSLAW